MVRAEPIIKVITCHCDMNEEKMQELIDLTPHKYVMHTITYNTFWHNCIIAIAFEKLEYFTPIHL